MDNCPRTVRVWLVSVSVLPGVEALPVSTPMKVKVGAVPPAPPMAGFEQEKVLAAMVQTKVSDGVLSELPVNV
jgi:hypothetical protein